MTNLSIKKRFPYEVTVIDNIWIPLSDGTKLAAKLFKPHLSDKKKVPAILEYIPYRKNDYTSVQDYAVHKYFAGYGYMSVRVDMRGSGESDGLLLDEYLKQEQEDGFEVVNWLSQQSWCSGNVGMIGFSWGGITSMQVASLNPKALKAIIPVTSSVDRYYDDAGYFLGCLVGQTIGWGVEMDSLSTRPPDPDIVGKRWKKIWKNRLQNTPPYVPIWLSHQEKDKYWLQGTISKNYNLIKCPVLATGGWADCWPNTVGRLVKNLNTNVKGISGPWGHNYSCFAKPGPQIDFLNECLKWWDKWLKNKNNGVDKDPKITAFIRKSMKPNSLGVDRPGYWIKENSWPPKSNVNKKFYLDENKLINTKKTLKNKFVNFTSPQNTGYGSGEYMPWFVAGEGPELPTDQKIDDVKSLTFDSNILKEDLKILGSAQLKLKVSSNQNCGMIAARICEIDKDGSSNLVTFGILNLAQRNGRNKNLKVIKNKFYNVLLNLNDTGYEFTKGNKIRIALSTSYWPMAWPLPKIFKLTLKLDECSLTLPKNLLKKEKGNLAKFNKPVSAEFRKTVQLKKPIKRFRKIIEDKEKDESRFEIFHDASWIGPGLIKILDNGMTLQSFVNQKFTINKNNPLSAVADYKHEHIMIKNKFNVKIIVLTKIFCDQKNFYYNFFLEAFNNNKKYFTKKFNKKIFRKGF